MKKIFTLIKNNYSINRSIPLILMMGITILMSVIGAMPVSDLESRYAHRLEAGFVTYEEYHEATLNLFDEMLGLDGAFSITLMITVLLLAFVSVLNLTGFMRDKSGIDFYHSVSVNRGEIYLAHYLTALINGAVTIILSQMLGLFFMSLIAKYPPYSFGEMLVMQIPTALTALLFLALFIALAMLSAIVSGTVFSTLVSYAFINFFIPATVLAVSVSGSVLFNSSLEDYLTHRPFAYIYTSPFIRYIFGVSEELFPFTLTSYILLALGTVAVVLLGIWLYGKKKNENSVYPFTFSFMKRPFQYLIAFDMILLGSTFFEAITSSLSWGVIGGLIALLFTFILTNAFFDKSFSGVFRRSRHMAFILIATILFGIVFVADAFGIYKEPSPSFRNIENAYVYVHMNTETAEYNYDFSFESEEKDWFGATVEKVDGEVKKDIEELYSFVKEKREERYVVSSSEYVVEKLPDTAPDESISISINFRCKNDFSGYYTHLNTSYGDLDYEETKKLAEKLIEKYSHNVYTYDRNGGYSESTEIIK